MSTSHNIDLSVNIGGIAMKNPVMVASGTFGYGPEYAELVDLNKLGAMVVKGICLNSTRGNATPRTAEVDSGLLNAIGLPGPGVDGFVRTYMPFLRQYDVPVIVNIWGKTIEEYAEGVKRIAETIRRITTKPWKLMEVCGGQTHAIVKFGIDELLPSGVTLLHGPGCPVCVTPVGIIDQALEIASRPGVIFCSFGDMLRVPGTQRDLFSVKASGGDVRMVYSPLDALKLARQFPDREVVFFAVGFETTAPANAMSVFQAAREGLTNFSLLVSHVLVPPAMEALLSSPDCQVQGFLAAGHVCAIAGIEPYIPLAKKYQVPIVITGFEPIDVLRGIHMCIQQLEEGRAECENAYARAVRSEGNPEAMAMVGDVFTVIDRRWRGMGSIPRSGLGLAPKYAAFDAEKKFELKPDTTEESSECISGLVLQGLKTPHECPAFGTRCTPEKPLGATMVSNEGACAAYYRYRKHEKSMVDG